MSVWQWFTLAKTETYRIHGNIRPRSIFAPVALDACRRANLRLGEFETIFIDFYRLCIPVLIRISLFLIFWRWGGGETRAKKTQGEKKIVYSIKRRLAVARLYRMYLWSFWSKIDQYQNILVLFGLYLKLRMTI